MNDCIKRRILPSLHHHWRQWRSTVFLVAFVIIPIKSSFADLNWVPTGSMNPTVLEGDMVLVNKAAYDVRLPLTLHSLKHISDPQRGDISILFSPEDGTRLLKRVIGIPGDELELRGNVLHLNGEPVEYRELPEEKLRGLNETLRNQSIFAEEQLGDHSHAVMSIPGIVTPARNYGPTRIPEGHYFVMGDNRDNSKDSRNFGFVERKQFVGKTERIVVSVNILDRYQPRFRRFFSKLD